jgi:hypothetical protein
MTLTIRTMRPVSRASLPRRIRGLGLWLDASVTSSLTFNGSGVSEWRDLSGSGRHFTQATAASQPNGVSRTSNGLRVLDFDGTQFLEGNAATLNLTRNVPGLTILMVGKADSQGLTPGRFYNFTCGGNDSSRVSLLVQQSNVPGEIWLRSRRLDNDVGEDAEYESGAAVRDADVFAAVIDYEAAESRLYAGGSLVASNVTMSTPGLSADTDSREASLGARFEDDVSAWIQHLNGFIGELIVYPRVLTDLERSRLEQYLIRKWNPQPEPVAARSLWLEEISDPVYHWSV